VEEDTDSYWITLRKREDTVILKLRQERQHWGKSKF